MLFVRFCFVSTVLLTITGCATFFGSKTQKITFNSEPSGAKVYIAGKNVGHTPVTVSLAVKTKYDVTYIKDNITREFTIKPHHLTTNIKNKLYCALDLFPGVIFLNAPIFIDLINHSCSSFDDAYFKSMSTSQHVIITDNRHQQTSYLNATQVQHLADNHAEVSSHNEDQQRSEVVVQPASSSSVVAPIGVDTVTKTTNKTPLPSKKHPSITMSNTN